MSKKPELTDLSGVGPKLEEKLRAAGIKTVNAMSKADAEKLSAKVDGLSTDGAQKLISAAQELVSATEEKPKKAAEEKPKAAPKKAAEEKPKPAAKKVTEKTPKAPVKKAAEEKPKAAPKKVTEEKPKKRKAEAAVTPLVDQRLLRVAKAQKQRKPEFRHQQAHRWTRVGTRWRKVRGIDNHTRQSQSGRIAMVGPGYRSPRAIRGLHPSGYEEILICKTADLEGLDPDRHAVRIRKQVGLRKRQDIIDKAEALMIHVINPGVPEGVEEEDLFEELEGLDDLEVD
jgi:large subunit ribosomal protein L32e